MGLLDWLTGARDVARVAIAFEPPDRADVGVDVFPAVTKWFLDAPSGNAALFFFYAAKAIHALGRTAQADDLRARLGADAITMLARDRLDPFTPRVDRPARCVGRLVEVRGRLSMSTRFPLPRATGNMNEYVAASVLALRDYAYYTQGTPERRQAIGGAIVNVERYYNLVTPSASAEAIRGAPVVALEHYLDSAGGSTGVNDVKVRRPGREQSGDDVSSPSGSS